MFDGYLKLAVWNKVAENGKGYGGILFLVKEKEARHIQLMKGNANKQCLWSKISKNENHIKIVACYFAPQVSKTYKNKGLDSNDLYAALKQDIATYYQQGEVLLVGDFNARTTNPQASIICCKEDHNPIWLTEEENPQWVSV